MENTDALLFCFINHTHLRSKGLDWFMFSLTQFGQGWLVLILLTGVYFGNNFEGSWYAESFVTVLAAGVICQIIKKYLPRSRPVSVLPHVNVLGKRLASGSFPSGHTATAFSLAIVFSSHWEIMTPVLLFTASLIGVTRIYVGAHFPLDVCCGAIIGLTTSSLVLTFLHIAPAYNIQYPFTLVFGTILLLALSLPFLGGYTFAKMAQRLREKIVRVQVVLQGR
ncbi:MAG: ybjG [Firmicutes bacterium]|nr:ybjG [Bacillota bacterium]